ncbi:conserved hypothetical protein [Verticillium alfalfae VaMs.102]|uniref:non-specific serine/threonine protein kinase n=1 Tax=Verticillium alfalfae (strain VaMs.102 / ATCC MYA-4576 / FGSC 10136) TaxID=526221 RepID=C9SZ27_VERA1|nr:conserved hypothetical protein [Verticillium alfalfae VaMs.102]EEY24042.1 conserved hypothetical protein [Verticillium alfalfae VaMs.102]
MADQRRPKIIEDNPIKTGLEGFRASFKAACKNEGIPPSLDSLCELTDDALDLILALQGCQASRLLRSGGRGKNLFSDLSRLSSAVNSDDFDFDRIKPLFKASLADTLDDALIWDHVYNTVAEATPPPRSIASSLQQTPWLRNTSGFANSSEHRKYMDLVLREELGTMHVGLPGFHKTYFGRVADLDTASRAIFEKCEEGSNPLFREGWTRWPSDANQDGVLSWFADISDKLAAFAESYKPTLTGRRPLAQPNKPIHGSTAERKLDVGFVNDPQARSDSRCCWSQILVPGELKSNPSADIASKAWLDLGRYAREVLTAQDTRRFVLGFTICGSLMRIWMFDRLGGIASERFDINHDGLQFVSTIIGFLWMDEEELGFDPTIITENGKRLIMITRNGQTERLVIDQLMKRAPCVAGRATTCWKAHCEEDPQSPIVIKDSWQFVERDEEGELLQEATGKDVVNVARYYHHETVVVRDEVDDIRGNTRRGLDATEAKNYQSERSIIPQSMSVIGPSRTGRSSTIGVKRSSSQTGAPVPPSKRSCSASPTKAGSHAIPNRVHRRVILRDYGKAIYKASSPSVLLAALEGCIEGHESLHKAGLLHRDISINNLMINEDDTNSSWPSFLIDLDLAIREQRDGASGARGKTGTRAFMAIGALLGEQHSFMHDLESFFWVLFWICIHYTGPDEGRVVARFDKWNYFDTEELATSKTGLVSNEGDFLRIIKGNCTSYYESLVPWVNRLRKVMFPNGGRWEMEDQGLYARMREILRKAQMDLSPS